MPGWVQEGWHEYAKRLPAHCALQLIEITQASRTESSSAAVAIKKEGERISAAIPKGARVIALDERGRQWSSVELSGQLDHWMHDGRDIALLVGGADGLDPSLRERADRLWSLSKLTLPHALVRVLVAEQVYRAWTLLSGHPYHRA